MPSKPRDGTLDELPEIEIAGPAADEIAPAADKVKRAPARKKGARTPAPKAGKVAAPKKSAAEKSEAPVKKPPAGPEYLPDPSRDRGIGQVLYLLGFYAECKLLLVGRVLRGMFSFFGQILVWLFGGVLRSIGRFFKGLWEDATAPLRRISSGVRNIRGVMAEERQKGGNAGRKAREYFGSGVKNYSHLVGNLLKLFLPIGAAAVLVFTVYTVLSMEYVLAVEINDTVVGYVADEDTYEQARIILRDRIVVADDMGLEQFTLTPRMSIGTANQLTPTTELVNNILLSQDRSDGTALTEATGIYIDGELKFVTTDIEEVDGFLAQMIEEKTDPDDPEASVQFVQDIEYNMDSEDLYYVASVDDVEDLKQELTSVVEEAEYYTATGGETLSDIAQGHDLTLNYLLAYNPDYVQALTGDADAVDEVEGTTTPEAGTVFLVRPQRNYLQVSKTYTTYRDEELEYGREEVENASMVAGRERVVSAGVPGIQRKYYYVVVVDGIKTELPAEDIPAETLQEPVNAVVQIGTAMVGTGDGTGVMSGSFLWPVPDYSYSSRGYLSYHNAQDINAPTGTAIIASNGGVVTTSGWHWSYGWHIVIDHGDGVQTLYAHSSELYVGVGELVDAGQVIAAVGSTGSSTGPHCHFEVIVDGVRTDPLYYVVMPPGTRG